MFNYRYMCVFFPFFHIVAAVKQRTKRDLEANCSESRNVTQCGEWCIVGQVSFVTSHVIGSLKYKKSCDCCCFFDSV